MKPLVVKAVLWGLAVAFGLGAFATILMILFVFSIGTAVATLDVTTTAIEKTSGQPVPECRLAFEKNQNKGWGQTEARTDARGVAQHQVSFMYGGSMLMFWDRDRHPELTMYIGAPPRYDTTDEVEMWVIQLPFDDPYFADRVSPQVRIERRIAVEDTRLADGRFQQAGSREAPGDMSQAIAPVEIRFSRDAEGREVLHIPLTVRLDPAQVKACTAAAPR